MKKKVTIVGSGLVGSLLATYLGKKGHDVHVYERRSDMRLANVSAGRSINMACSTRGWQALDLVGVGDLVREAAIPMFGRQMHSVNGKLTDQTYGKDDEAIYSISRAGLNKILMSYAEKEVGVKFHFDHKCTELDLESATTTFTHLNNSIRVEADMVFGADGAFSAVRGIMQRLRHFDYSQEYISSDYKELCIPAGPNGTHLIEKNALHIWPRGDFMLIALPNPDGSFTCTLFMPYAGEKAFENIRTPEEIKSFFKETFPDAYEIMPTLVEDFQNNPQSPLCIIKCFPWVYKDKVALIGDASHAIVPFYGQGMISGFEDCFILNQMMEQFGDDWQNVFSAFQAERKPNGDAIADLALENYVVMRDKVGDPDFLLQKKFEKRISELYPDEYLPLYSMVTFSHLPYSKAKEIGKLQDKKIKEILAEHDVQAIIDSEKLDDFIHDQFEKLRNLGQTNESVLVDQKKMS